MLSIAQEEQAERALANASIFCQEAVVRTRVRGTYEGITRSVTGQDKTSGQAEESELSSPDTREEVWDSRKESHQAKMDRLRGLLAETSSALEPEDGDRKTGEESRAATVGMIHQLAQAHGLSSGLHLAAAEMKGIQEGPRGMSDPGTPTADVLSSTRERFQQLMQQSEPEQHSIHQPEPHSVQQPEPHSVQQPEPQEQTEDEIRATHGLSPRQELNPSLHMSRTNSPNVSAELHSIAAEISLGAIAAVAAAELSDSSPELSVLTPPPVRTSRHNVLPSGPTSIALEGQIEPQPGAIWQPHTDPDSKRIYWFNHATGESSWTAPPESAVPKEGSAWQNPNKTHVDQLGESLAAHHSPSRVMEALAKVEALAVTAAEMAAADDAVAAADAARDAVASAQTNIQQLHNKLRVMENEGHTTQMEAQPVTDHHDNEQPEKSEPEEKQLELAAHTPTLMPATPQPYAAFDQPLDLSPPAAYPQHDPLNAAFEAQHHEEVSTTSPPKMTRQQVLLAAAEEQARQTAEAAKQAHCAAEEAAQRAAQCHAEAAARASADTGVTTLKCSFEVRGVRSAMTEQSTDLEIEQLQQRQRELRQQRELRRQEFLGLKVAGSATVTPELSAASTTSATELLQVQVMLTQYS